MQAPKHVAIFFGVIFSCSLANAQTPPIVPQKPTGLDQRDEKALITPKKKLQADALVKENPLHAKLKKLLTGAKLTGLFTVDGKDLSNAKEEAYAISSLEHVEGDQWIINASINYGKTDATIPVPIDVKWAGTTPVMVLDKVTLIGLGTFSARVVFSGDKYAGTWQHDDKGGHLFGRVKFASEK